MSIDQKKIFSTIKGNFKRKKLYQGSGLALIGLTLLFYGATIAPKEFLPNWGWLIFFAAFVLFVVGLYPYRQLIKLESQPSLFIYNQENLSYQYQGKLELKIPWKAITQLNYLENSNTYGILLTLALNPEEKIIVFTRTSLGFIYNMQKNEIFIPYFSKNSFEELQDIFLEEKQKNSIDVSPG